MVKSAPLGGIKSDIAAIMNHPPKYSGIAHVAIRSGGHHRAALHLSVVHNIVSQIGRAPDAEHGAHAGRQCAQNNHNRRGDGEARDA